MDNFLSILDATLQYAVPILLAAIGGLYSERSGVINIALDGLVIMGAFVAAIASNSLFSSMGLTGNLLSILCATLAGLLFSLLHAVASIHFRADQVISGTAINMIAPALTLLLAKVYTGGGYDIVLDNVFQRWAIIPGKLEIYPTVLIAIVIVAITWYLLYRRPFGLRLRAVGEHPSAADSMGINVYKIRYTGVLVSGALGGLAGGVIVLTFAQRFDQSVTVYGFGFLALAALVFGKWTPLGTTLAALFFGLTKVFAEKVSILFPALAVSKELWNMFPFIMTIIALVLFSKSAIAPKALGQSYDKGSR